SGKLLGPLAGGVPVLTLEDGTPFELSRGAIGVRAVGHATYLLHAIVEDQGAQLQIIRTLVLDAFTPSQYAALRLVPHTVLPYGRVDAYWAAWGVSMAMLRVGETSTRRLLGSSSETAYLDGDGIYGLQVESKNLSIQLEYESRRSDLVKA